jgi:hypothetical protein
MNSCTHKICRTTEPCRFEEYGKRYGAKYMREALILADEPCSDNCHSGVMGAGHLYCEG